MVLNKHCISDCRGGVAMREGKTIWWSVWWCVHKGESRTLNNIVGVCKGQSSLVLSILISTFNWGGLRTGVRLNPHTCSKTRGVGVFRFGLETQRSGPMPSVGIFPSLLFLWQMPTIWAAELSYSVVSQYVAIPCVASTVYIHYSHDSEQMLLRFVTLLA